jgi:hypothetical protein
MLSVLGNRWLAFSSLENTGMPHQLKSAMHGLTCLATWEDAIGRPAIAVVAEACMRVVQQLVRFISLGYLCAFVS